MKNWHEGSNALSIMSPLIDQDTVKPLCGRFSSDALTCWVIIMAHGLYFYL